MSHKMGKKVLGDFIAYFRLSKFWRPLPKSPIYLKKIIMMRTLRMAVIAGAPIAFKPVFYPFFGMHFSWIFSIKN